MMIIILSEPPYNVDSVLTSLYFRRIRGKPILLLNKKDQLHLISCECLKATNGEIWIRKCWGFPNDCFSRDKMH